LRAAFLRGFRVYSLNIHKLRLRFEICFRLRPDPLYCLQK